MLEKKFSFEIEIKSKRNVVRKKKYITFSIYLSMETELDAFGLENGKIRVYREMS